MSRSRLLRRFAAVTIGVLALLGPHLVTNGGAAPDECPAKRHGCGRISLAACCCPAPVAPAAQAARPSGEAAAPAAQRVERAPDVACLPGGLEARVPSPPPLRSAGGDLPILFSAILI